MNSLILTALALAAWAFTLFRLRAIDWDDVRKGRGNDLDIAAMLFFAALGLTAMITEVAVFLDAHTSPNLAMLVTQCSYLAAGYFLVAASLTALDPSSSRRAIRLLRLLLGLTVGALLLINLLFLSKLPPSPQFWGTQSLPELISKLTGWAFSLVLSVTLAWACLAHLPAKELPVWRLRALAFVVCAVGVAGQLLANSIMVLVGYFWPVLSLSWLSLLATLFTVCAILAFLAALLGSPLYARFVMLSRGLARWRAFQDVQYLAQRMMQLFPPVVLPPTAPTFWQFLRKPECHLYSAMIVIMDGRSMLNSLMKEIEVSPPPTHEMYIEMMAEAREIHQVLQSVHPTGDLFEIVEAYRRASVELFTQHKKTA